MTLVVERNADFVNLSHGEVEELDFRGRPVTTPESVIEQSGVRVRDLDLLSFTSAIEMGKWEFAAYTNYGGDRCFREKIETLADLFGQAFSDAFYARKRVLIAEWSLVEAREEARVALARVAALERLIERGGIEEDGSTKDGEERTDAGL